MSGDMETLVERLGRKYLRTVDHAGEDWQLVNPDGPEAASAIQALIAERDSAVANAEIVCNSYAAENQRLSDRAEASEARAKELANALGTARADLEKAGFVGVGHWGAGDAEINQIDAALRSVKETEHT